MRLEKVNLRAQSDSGSGCSIYGFFLAIAAASACSSTDSGGASALQTGGSGGVHASGGGSPDQGGRSEPPPSGGSPASGGAASGSAGVGGGSGSGGRDAIGGRASGGSIGTGGSEPVAGANGGMAGSGTSGGSSGAPSGGSAGGGSAQGGSQGGQAAPDPGPEGDGDFELGPTYTTQPELTDRGAPKGKSFQFSMPLAESKIFDGTDETLDDSKPVNTTRSISVYVPARYQDGSEAPVLVIQDGPGELGLVKTALDNLTIADDPKRRIPAFVAIAVQNGGNDSKGSERGLEYDTMSDRYARFIDLEVLPAVEGNASVKAAYPNLTLTRNPQGRAALGCSSGAAAALTMAWFRPDLFSRVISYSGTFVDQQDDDAPEEAMYPLGAWEYHSGSSLIANSEKKPIRIFMNVNENDLGARDQESTHHNWVMANQRTAAALKSKGYHYRYVYGRGVGHCDGSVKSASLADALIWVWRGYPAP